MFGRVRTSATLTNEEDPLPALEVAHARHALMNRSHHDSREHGANLARGGEQGGTLGDLIGLVPGTNDVDGTGVGARLSKAEEEADNAELSNCLDSGTDHLEIISAPK